MLALFLGVCARDCSATVFAAGLVRRRFFSVLVLFLWSVRAAAGVEKVFLCPGPWVAFSFLCILPGQGTLDECYLCLDEWLFNLLG